ncbi:hypothetical protein B4Q13_21765, partial [Lacticaseibacillus rhamnosus]
MKAGRGKPEGLITCQLNAAARISGNLSLLTHVRPLIGRDFMDADTAAGAPAVTVIGHGLWLSRYGGDASVVGRTLQVNGIATTIVGVMPEKFGFPKDAELWLPLSLERPTRRGEGPQV